MARRSSDTVARGTYGRTRRTRWFACAAAAVLVSCGGGSEDKPPPDPAGTVTVNLADGNRIQPAVEQCGSGAPSLSCSSGCIWSNVFVYFTASNLNLTMASSSNCTSQYDLVGIADVGPVSGLAAVPTSDPAGYTGVVAAQVGHGYVMRYHESVSGTTYHLRLYVDGWLTSALTGGVTGVRIKYLAF